MTQSTIDSEVDQILCDLHDLGFHGKGLAHLETLADYILEKAAQEANKARIDELELAVQQYIHTTKSNPNNFSDYAHHRIKILEKYREGL